MRFPEKSLSITFKTMNNEFIKAMRFTKGPSAWSKHPVCTFTVESAGIKSPDEPRMAVLKDLGLPLPVGFSSAGLWLAKLAQSIQGYAANQGDFFSSRPVSEQSKFLTLAFSYSEEEVARDSLLCALWFAQMPVILPCADPAEIPNHIRKSGHKHGLGPSTHAIWQAAVDHHIPVWKLSDCSLLQMGVGRMQQRVWTAETGQTPLLAENIAQDKDWTRQLLETIGVPVPQGRVVVSREDAWAAAQEIGLPVVVKPQFGSQGNGVSINLLSEQQVLDAFDNANAFGYSVVAESFKEGADYRILVIGDKMIAASLREPAQVIGDGVSTINQLVQVVNQDPRRADSHAGVLSPIPLDPVSLAVIESQGMTVDSIPDKGVKVLIRRNANLSTGGTAKDVTDIVHPQVATLAISAARQLGLDISGVDIISSDISKPLSETGGAVVEVNAGPGLRMHLEPSEGKGRPVGKAIVEMLFPKPARSMVPMIAFVSSRGKASREATFGKVRKSFGSSGLINSKGLFIDDTKIANRSSHAGMDVLRLCQHPDLKALVAEFTWEEFVRDGLGLSCYSLIVCEDSPLLGDFSSAELLLEIRHALCFSGIILVPQEIAASAPAQPTFWSKAVLSCDSKWNECLKYLALNPSGIIHTRDHKLSFYRGEIKQTELPMSTMGDNGSSLDAAIGFLVDQIAC